MRIAFLGQIDSFSYHKIGGTESIIRRISLELIRSGHDVGYIRFGTSAPTDDTTISGINMHNYIEFDDALVATQNYDHIITVYIPPRLRFTYASFRKRQKSNRIFHTLIQNWPDSRFKREMALLDSKIYPYSGKYFCVSERLYNRIHHRKREAVLLFPPVPDEFFLSPDEKPQNAKLRLVYMGRLDSGKGTATAINLFHHLAPYTHIIEPVIYGYAWPHDKASWSLHQTLLKQDGISYIPTEHHGYTPDTNETIHQILTNTDALFLPYERLSSTIDTPLVMLEGMAHLTAIITAPLGNLPAIYGSNQFMVKQFTNLKPIIKMVLNLEASLVDEQKRLSNQVKQLGYQTSNITTYFINELQG